MKIWYFTPYALSKDLGAEYNSYMRLIPEEDSACFQDGDSLHLVPEFGHLIHSYAERFPDAVLTAKTNRIHVLSKQLDGAIDEVCDVREQMMKAESRKHLSTVTEILPGEGMSGVLMLVPKKVWQKVPFVETGKALGIDSQFRMDLHKAGVRIFIMDAILVFHTYRLLNGVQYKSHLL